MVNTRSREGLPLSKPSDNLEGCTEAELRARRLAETVPSRQYKVRRRRAVPIEEQEQIVNAYLKDFVPQKEVAQRHRVTVQLVSDLVAEAKA